MSSPIISDLTLRAYFASVIGGFRQVYGQRRNFLFPAGSVTTQQLVENSTKDRVLSVFVSRSDVTGAATPATFTQNNNGAGTNDFSILFTALSQQRFVLYPGDTLALQSAGTNAMNVVVQQEGY